MTPGARVQAAIDILDATLAAAREGGAAADTLIARYFAERRYAGSKDRRAVRDLAYAAIRRAGEHPVSGRAAMLGLARERPELTALFDGSGHGPAPIAPGEPVARAGVAPKWLVDALSYTLDPSDLSALLDRAPLDLRVNALATSREAVLATMTDAQPVDGLPHALRLPEGTRIDATAEWSAGQIEVQDAGSQCVTMAAHAQPGMTVIDLCAGAGGKTLALAAAMANRGRIMASDTDRNRLSRLAPRAERAGVTIVETRLLDGSREGQALADLRGSADVVLVDAPCSGTGTWRRNPEARWRLTPKRLDVLVGTQARLLDVAATLVRPGGALIHIVCSLLDQEGAGQVAGFLTRHPGWRAEPLALPLGAAHKDGWRLMPSRDGTDGFFVARLACP